MQKEIIKYDDDFKRAVVDMLENGTFKSVEACKRALKIFGSGTISRWIHQYNPDLVPLIKQRNLKSELIKMKETDPQLYEKIVRQVE